MINLQVKTTRRAVWVKVNSESEAQAIADCYSKAWKDDTVSVRDESGKTLARAKKTCPIRPRREWLAEWEVKSAIADILTAWQA